MDNVYPKILASQECSTMVSTWNEYLRLGKRADNSAVLEICQYATIGEMQYDEDGNQILPPDIDPKDVVEIEDGYIFGGALTSEFGETFQFTAETIPEAIEWLMDNGWKGVPDIETELAKAVGGHVPRSE